ncbi:MAG: hypothetical protein RBS02_17770 [Steroidobacteraceae bacterium]|jgi:hypothetical protein|nr:hypothetical protein [Steroidobacteraceae bacterium]
MFARLVLALPLICLSGVVQSAEEPQWLKDARAREGKLRRAITVKDSEGFFSTKLPVKLVGKVEQQEGGYMLTLDIGSEAPMTCEVLHEEFDLAGTLGSVAQSTFAEIEPIQGKIDVKAVEQQDAGVMGRSPFMAVDWLYRVNGGEGPKLGALKQIAAIKDGRGLYCSHIDIGYTKSFRSVATAFIESIEFANPEPQPLYFEISTASLGDRRIGVAIASMQQDEDGDNRLVNMSSLLVPVTPDTLTAQDAYHIQWARPDATMINATHVVSSDGEIETNLSLRRAEDGGWMFEGIFNQKEIAGTIGSEADPATWLAQARARRALFDREDVVGATLSERVWTTASPESFIDWKTTVTAVVNERQLATREETAGMVIDAVVDRVTGMPEAASMPLGPQSLKLERVYVQGSF